MHLQQKKMKENTVVRRRAYESAMMKEGRYWCRKRKEKSDSAAVATNVSYQK